MGIPKIKKITITDDTPVEEINEALNANRKTVKVAKRPIVVKQVTVEEKQKQIETLQDKRSRWLTEAQKNWEWLQWEQFVDEHAMTPSDELTEKVVNQLNFGRAFMREQREAVGMTRRKALTEQAANLANVEQVAHEAREKASKTELAAQELAQSKVEKAKQLAANIKSDIKEVLGTATNDAEAGELADSILDEFEKLADEEDEAEGQVEVPEEAHGFHTIDIEEAKLFEANPMKKMWETAEELARKGKNETWNDLGFQMKRMVEYCAESIKDTGGVEYPFEFTDIYWARPTNSSLCLEDFANTRRDMVVTRIRAWWYKRMEKAEVTQLTSNSYRKTLAQMRLSRLIELYVVNPLHAGKATHKDDEDLMRRIQEATVEMYHAYEPIPEDEIKPGPITMIDPDFVTYCSIVRQYKLEFGQLLHTVIE